MPRPDFPNPYCPMTANMIQRIKENQDAYDRDPEGWERRERQHKEEQELERERERQQEEEHYRNLEE